MNTDPADQGDRLAELVRTYPGGNLGLAEALGVTASQVSRWRNGRTRITWARAEQLADALGVSPGFLYAGIEGWMPPHLVKEAETGEPSTVSLQHEVDFTHRRVDKLARELAELKAIVAERFGDVRYSEPHTGRPARGDEADDYGTRTSRRPSTSD